MRRDGREAEGGGLLIRYRGYCLYPGFESLSLRFILLSHNDLWWWISGLPPMKPLFAYQFAYLAKLLNLHGPPVPPCFAFRCEGLVSQLWTDRGVVRDSRGRNPEGHPKSPTCRGPFTSCSFISPLRTASYAAGCITSCTTGRPIGLHAVDGRRLTLLLTFAASTRSSAMIRAVSGSDATISRMISRV